MPPNPDAAELWLSVSVRQVREAEACWDARWRIAAHADLDVDVWLHIPRIALDHLTGQHWHIDACVTLPCRHTTNTASAKVLHWPLAWRVDRHKHIFQAKPSMTHFAVQACKHPSTASELMQCTANAEELTSYVEVILLQVRVALEEASQEGM